jgi:hypothetical protein
MEGYKGDSNRWTATGGPWHTMAHTWAHHMETDNSALVNIVWGNHKILILLMMILGTLLISNKGSSLILDYHY